MRVTGFVVSLWMGFLGAGQAPAELEPEGSRIGALGEGAQPVVPPEEPPPPPETDLAIRNASADAGPPALPDAAPTTDPAMAVAGIPAGTPVSPMAEEAASEDRDRRETAAPARAAKRKVQLGLRLTRSDLEINLAESDFLDIRWVSPEGTVLAQTTGLFPAGRSAVGRVRPKGAGRHVLEVRGQKTGITRRFAIP